MTSDSGIKAWPLIGAVGVLLVLAILAQSGAFDSGHGKGTVNAPAQGAPPDAAPVSVDPALPSREWDAVGRVVWTPPREISDQPVGTVLHRPWSFRSDCDRGCPVVFSRQTLYGPSTTTLVRQGGYFVADFPPVTVPCAYPEGSTYPRRPTGQSHDLYRLSWSGDGSRIEAVEYRTKTGCYAEVFPPDVTRWLATRG